MPKKSVPNQPNVSAKATSNKIEKDQVFEDYLKAQNPSKTVARLARKSFYGADVFRVLYPDDAAAPPDIRHDTPRGPTGPTGPARLRYAIEDIEAADDIVSAFDEEHPERANAYGAALMEWYEGRSH